MAGNQDGNGPGTDQNQNANAGDGDNNNAGQDQNTGAGASQTGGQDQSQNSGGNQDQGATPPGASGAGEEPPVRVDWRDRRIGELTARNREQRAELERLRAGQTPPNGHQGGGQDNRGDGRGGYDAPPPNQAEIDRNVEQRAQILAANQEFNRRCNEAAEAGRRAFGDFDSRVSKLVGLVDNNDPQSVGVYNAFLNAGLETGEDSRIIHTLGGDLNEASRILSLNPVRMAVELTRLAAKPVQELSQTPRPINPAATNAQAARTSTSPDDPGSDQLSTEEWMRRRNEQITARGVRR